MPRYRAFVTYSGPRLDTEYERWLEGKGWPRAVALDDDSITLSHAQGSRANLDAAIADTAAELGGALDIPVTVEDVLHA